MKKRILSVAATLGATIGALAQGNFALDNSPIPSGLAVDAPANWHNGTFGMEVWVSGGTSIPDGINLVATPGSGLLGYSAMLGAGFVKEATYTNQQTAAPGTFSLGAVFMPHAHSGGTLLVALAVWNTSAASWSAMLANATQATRAGIVVFQQPTIATMLNPGAPPPLAMDQDLALTAVTAAPMPAAVGRPATRPKAPPTKAAPARNSSSQGAAQE